MADWYDHIDDERRAFIERQHIFFVATAPADGDSGYPNLSPKGRSLLRVLGPNSSVTSTTPAAVMRPRSTLRTTTALR